MAPALARAPAPAATRRCRTALHPREETLPTTTVARGRLKTGSTPPSGGFRTSGTVRWEEEGRGEAEGRRVGVVQAPPQGVAGRGARGPMTMVTCRRRGTGTSAAWILTGHRPGQSLGGDEGGVGEAQAEEGGEGLLCSRAVAAVAARRLPSTKPASTAGVRGRGSIRALLTTER